MATPHARALQRLREQIDELRRLAALDEGALFATSTVSAWTPAEHADHLIKVCTSVVQRLLDARPPAELKRLNVIGRLILLAGRIPRGRGRSPERLRGARVSAAELLESLQRLEAGIEQLNESILSAKRGRVVPHPYFGGLDPLQAIRFAVIHNRHHLLIINDVLHSRRKALPT
jgi:hypothetical protein